MATKGKQGVSVDLHWIGIVAAVVLVDLSLSGDNAVVIGAVAARLPPHRQRFAISFGILMAIVARIALAATAVLVLRAALSCRPSAVWSFFSSLGR